MTLAISLMNLLGLACVLALYLCVACCAAWAYSVRDWLLAIALTIIFLASTVAFIWWTERSMTW